MAGFFGLFDYNKPGKGVNKGEPQKKGIARFFELFFRKFWNYLKLNLLYGVTCIPAFVYYVLVVSWLFGDFAMNASLGEKEAVTGFLMLSAVFALAIIIFCAGSPFITGYTYILRNYVREEHAWLVSDFFEQTKKNFKQGIAAFFIDIVVMTLFLINLRFYIMMSGMGIVYVALGAVFAVIFVLYLMMHSYLWTMMVTFSLKLKQLYKNALLLSILALPRSLGGIIVRGAIFGILFFAFIPPAIAFLLCVFIMISALGLINQMFAYPVIKKFMLDKIEVAEEEYIEENDDIYGDEEEYVYPEVLNENDVASLFKNKDGEEDK